MITQNINRTNGKDTEIDFDNVSIKDRENLSFIIIDKITKRKIKLNELVYYYKNTLTLFIPNQIKIPPSTYTYTIAENGKVVVNGEIKVK